MRTLKLAAGLAFSLIMLGFTITPSSAQQTCGEIDAVTIQCQSPSVIGGEPPGCTCDGLPMETGLELSCAINFCCADSSFVGAGEWPECWCRKVKSGETPPGGGGHGGDTGGVGGSMGGAETCSQFFECPSGSTMSALGGQCQCTLVMLPAIKE